MTAVDVALLLLRLWAAIVIIAHGVNHGRTQEGTAKWFASKGFRSPELNARISALNEIAIGLALIAGFLTSVAVAALVATMFVAFWTIHRFAGFFNFHRPDEGWEYVPTVVNRPEQFGAFKRAYMAKILSERRKDEGLLRRMKQL